jgi:hypothetical protein
MSTPLSSEGRRSAVNKEARRLYRRRQQRARFAASALRGILAGSAPEVDPRTSALHNASLYAALAWSAADEMMRTFEGFVEEDRKALRAYRQKLRADADEDKRTVDVWNAAVDEAHKAHAEAAGAAARKGKVQGK